jgi:hypothetical protein
MRKFLFSGLAAILLAMAPAGAVNDVLSDSDLASRVSAVFASKDAPPDRVLGLHKGLPVLLDIRCSDLCPANTVRIVHYIGAADAACAAAAGDLVNIAVPRGITMGPEKFCVPHVLAGRHLYTDQPYRK